MNFSLHMSTGNHVFYRKLFTFLSFILELFFIENILNSLLLNVSEI